MKWGGGGVGGGLLRLLGQALGGERVFKHSKGVWQERKIWLRGWGWDCKKGKIESGRI